jgi:hypothetical protein
MMSRALSLLGCALFFVVITIRLIIGAAALILITAVMLGFFWAFGVAF